MSAFQSMREENDDLFATPAGQESDGSGQAHHDAIQRPFGGQANGTADPHAVLALYGGLYDGNAGATKAPPAAKPKGPKKSATKAEVARIQATIHRARKAEAEAGQLGEDAEVMEALKDPHARDKRRQQHAKILEARNAKRQAMTEAISAYGIDITHVSKLGYGWDNDGGQSETDDDRAVSIGDAAFETPGYLASTIAHETEVHAKQTHEGRSYSGMQGRRLIETEAYDWEIKQAPRFGLTREQLDGTRRLRAHYLDELKPEIRALRDRGVYRMPKGHEED